MTTRKSGLCIHLLNSIRYEYLGLATQFVVLRPHLLVIDYILMMCIHHFWLARLLQQGVHEKSVIWTFNLREKAREHRTSEERTLNLLLQLVFFYNLPNKAKLNYAMFCITVVIKFIKKWETTRSIQNRLTMKKWLLSYCYNMADFKISWYLTLLCSLFLIQWMVNLIM